MGRAIALTAIVGTLFGVCAYESFQRQALREQKRIEPYVESLQRKLPEECTAKQAAEFTYRNGVYKTTCSGVEYETTATDSFAWRRTDS